MQFATVKPEGLNLHASADLKSRVVDSISRGDRVRILDTDFDGNIPMYKIEVVGTSNGIQVGNIGWVRSSLVEVEKAPRLPDVEPCEPETEYVPLGKYLLWGAGAVIVIVVLSWLLG